jgi:hypothetical protein
MRALTLFALLVAGCGAADMPTTVSCNDLAAELAMTAKENARCIDDAQCRFIDDACLDGCALFANADGLAAAQPIIAEAEGARCNAGCSCLALRPACRDGRCVAWTPPPP